MTTKHNLLEIKFNEDRTQALATLYPPREGGEPLHVCDVLERLKSMGVTYGLREQAILEATQEVKRSGTALRSVLVAQGTMPQDGVDARIRCALPLELLSLPLPKNAHGQPDWFALHPGKMVQADQELACIQPALAGIAGKTLTWPVQVVPARQGKPAAITAGSNVRVSSDGLRFTAAADGYACLHKDTLAVHALRRIAQPVQGGQHQFPTGAVFLEGARGAHIHAGSFIAIAGTAQDCSLRAQGDIIVRHAVNCALIATGSVYVLECLRDCEVNTPNKVIALPGSSLVGGSLCATGGIEAGSLGTADFTPMEVFAGVDKFSRIRGA